MTNYKTLDLEREDQVATVTIYPQEETMTEPGIDLHHDFAEAMTEIRSDNGIRVVVLEGQRDDGNFFLPPPADFYVKHEDVADYVMSADGSYRTFTHGIIRFHQSMAEMEKVIVAKVNGDVSALGMSMMLACDLIVAVEDAEIVDIHLGVGENPPGPEFGIVPGDGGCALVPLYMPPPLAKEFLMLGRPISAQRMADMGIINYAVPEDELEETVADIVARLLDRPAYALAWTKRVANRRVVDHLSKTLDAAAAYEMVNFLQLETEGEQSHEF